MPTTTFTTLASHQVVRTQCAHCSSVWDWNMDPSVMPTCPVCGYTDPLYGQWLNNARMPAADVKEAEIDFGAYPRASIKVTVTDASVTPSTQLLVGQSGTAATGRKADENEMEAFSIRAVAGSGSFTVYANCLTGRASGKYVIAYLLG